MITGLIFCQIDVINSGYVGVNNSSPQTVFQVNSNQTSIGLGSANYSGLNWGTSYMGLNAIRKADGNWISKTDGAASNGGSVIFGGLDGSINFAPIPSTGNTNQNNTDSYVKNKVALKIGYPCFISGGSNNPPAGCNFYYNGAKTLWKYEPYSGYTSKSLYFDLSPSDPRIYAASYNNHIVFYNSNNAQFQDIQARSFIVASDKNLKTNVNTISNSTNIINSLRGVSFNWVEDKPNSPKSYGFIAQELEEVIPDIVFTDDTAHLKTVNYLGVIPFLVEAFKEQNKIISIQEEKINKLEKLINSDIGKIGFESKDETNSVNNSKLYQNTTSSYSKTNSINYFVSENAVSPSILIFDMQGTLLKTYPITKKGNGTLEIKPEELKPAMYMYSLIVEGKEIDTKKMILTD